MLRWQKLNLEFEACDTRTEYTDLKVRLEAELGAVYGVAWLDPREAGNQPYPCFYRQAEGTFAFTSSNSFSDDDWWHMQGRSICCDRPMNSAGDRWDGGRKNSKFILRLRHE